MSSYTLYLVSSTLAYYVSRLLYFRWIRSLLAVVECIAADVPQKTVEA